MQSFRLAALVLAVSLAGACGNPTRPSDTASDLAITGPAAALTGLPATYTATVTLGDGTQRTATATWTSSNPQVAVVDNAGRFERRTHGWTELTASFVGRQATKTVPEVTNYAGSWSGRYVVRACTKTEGHDRDGGCRGVVGSEAAVNLRLTQGGDTLRDIVGSMDLGVTFAYGLQIKGNVTSDGRLNLDGTF